jgi:hypothetical protein
MKRSFYLALFYLVFGLSFGVFYREFTRAMDFEGNTALSFVHPHILTLGFLFFILVLVLNKIFKLTEFKYYKSFIVIYNLGFILSVLAMICRGILDVMVVDFNALSYIAGMGHMILAVGLSFFMVNLYLSIKSKKHAEEKTKNNSNAQKEKL